MINRKAFFDRVRMTLYGGQMGSKPVQGINAILDEWEARKLTDLRWLAYMLATAYHEAGRNMLPVREIGRGKGRLYGIPDLDTRETYYGRGLVQLTWAANYRNMGKLLGLPLYENPDLALDPKIAVQIMFEGMTKGASLKGDFTGKSLEDYFNDTTSDWVGARRIINRLDRADLIAGYAKVFYSALKQEN